MVNFNDIFSSNKEFIFWDKIVKKYLEINYGIAKVKENNWGKENFKKQKMDVFIIVYIWSIIVLLLYYNMPQIPLKILSFYG